MKKYLIYFNWQMVLPFYGIMLHELNKLLDDPGNEIFLFSCDGKLNNCFVNKLSDRALCKICIFAKRVGEKPYSGRIRLLEIGEFVDIEKIHFPEFKYKSVTEIKKIEYKGCFIGYGALSSYVSYTRNMEPLIDDNFRSYFDSLLQSQIILISVFEKILSETKFEGIYLYNGRWADVRPIYDICKRNNINVNVLESINNGTTSFEREIYVNVLPQNIDFVNKKIEKTWEDSPLDYNEKVEIATEFYEKSRRSENTRHDLIVYTKNQIANKLPDNWNDNKINISILNSSEDEFIALGEEWEKYRIFPSQEQGIIEILTLFKRNGKYHFYLRIHPNLSEVKYGYHKRLINIEKEFNNITVIPAESQVNTYSLIENSQKVIVFGSTVGIEACYLRKPVILLGGTFYYLQNSAYIPKTLSELHELILDEIPPKPIEGAIKYGFYLMNHKSYTETIFSEPYPLKIFGMTMGYGFKYMKILGSPILFKIIYKCFIIVHQIYRKIIPNKISIPLKDSQNIE
jgi:hypothetical protein